MIEGPQDAAAATLLARRIRGNLVAPASNTPGMVPDIRPLDMRVSLRAYMDALERLQGLVVQSRARRER